MRGTTHLLLRILLAAGVAGVGVSMPCANAAPADGYSIVKKIPLPGEGSWDYLTVDEGVRRLYVTHATQVQVIDIDAGSVVGTHSEQTRSAWRRPRDGSWQGIS